MPIIQVKRDATVSLLNALMTAKNVTAQDTLFNFIMNNTDTDISVVDYSKVSSALTLFVQERAEMLLLPQMNFRR